MKKVAVFGNAGGGKSALAQRLAELTGLPLYVVDMMQFKPGGAKVRMTNSYRRTPISPSVTNGSSTVLAIWRLPGSGSPPPIR
jgi:ATP-dependent protease HslVU (ClpYQ) ATPase subunit